MSAPNTRKKMAKLARLGLLVVLAVACPRGLALPAGEQPAELEQALRQRVQEYYSLLQLGRWTQAEAYVTEDTREEYRNQNKNAFLGFSIAELAVDPDGSEAKVTVQIHFFTGISPQPVASPRRTHWRLEEDGLWYVEIPKPDPRVLDGVFGGPKREYTPPPEELKFEGHRYGLGRVERGQIKQARFPFTNVTDHVVTLSEVLTGCECLQDKTKKREYQPGESGELVIEFNPEGYQRDYIQTILVKTNPGDVTSYLTVAAYVMPPPHDFEPAKSSEKSEKNDSGS